MFEGLLLFTLVKSKDESREPFLRLLEPGEGADGGEVGKAEIGFRTAS